MALSFDDLENLNSGSQNRIAKPIWKLNLNEKEELLKWLNGEINYLKGESKERLRQIEKNLQLYKGIQYETQEVRQAIRDRGDDRSRSVKRIVVNHLYDLTESHVSRAVKYKPGISITPTNDEFDDRIDAKLNKALIDHIWYDKDFRGDIVPEGVRDSKVAGEHYLFIGWNEDLGPDFPKLKEAQEQGKDIRMLDDDGKPIKNNATNEELKVERLKIGDVEYKVVFAHDIFLEKKRKYREVDYLFRREVKNIDEIKKDHPNIGDIQPEMDTNVYDPETMEMRKLDNQAMVWEFWHRPTKHLPNGLYIKFVHSKIVEIQKFPFKHGKLPFIRLIDIEIPNERHGVSFYQIIKSQTTMYNHLTNMIIRNQTLASQPKWMMPAGACKLESLGNDLTIVQYKGPVPPQLVQLNPTPREVFEFRKDLKEEFQTLSGIHGVSRGEPPQGVKAGIALQFLEEQENQRANMFILRFNEYIKEVAEMTLSVASQFYKRDDERMIRIQGKNNKWMLKKFDPDRLKDISTRFSITIANSSALPESRAGKIQTIIDLNEAFPNMFQPEQILDMLDFAQADKFYNDATEAVKTAEAENEEVIESGDPGKPEEHEKHVIHWKIHTRYIQSYSFKQLEDEQKQALIDHIRTHEMFMDEKAQINPKMAEQIAQLEEFPMFYVSKRPAAPTPQMGGSISPQPQAPQTGASAQLSQQSNQQVPNNQTAENKPIA